MALDRPLLKVVTESPSVKEESDLLQLLLPKSKASTANILLKMVFFVSAVKK